MSRDAEKTWTHGQPFNWNEIIKIFKDRTGLDTTWKVARNKLEHIKRFWRAWDEMKNKETGCGWDENLNTAKAEDSWWDKKVKDRPEFKRFRGGIDHEITDLWTEVFSGIVATGKRCVAPTMDPSAIPVDEEGDGEFDWEQELEEVEAEPMLTPVEVDMTGFTVEDDGDAELNGGSRQQSKGKRTEKRKGKRLSNSQSTYNQHFEMMGQTSQKLFSILDDDEGSSQPKKGRKVHDLGDALPVIEEMVEKGVTAEGGELWCIAIAELLIEESHELFMRLKSDFARISWLQFRLKYKQA